MEPYQRLRDMREDHDLTQKDIAEILQTTQEQISKYEIGKQMMGSSQMFYSFKGFQRAPPDVDFERVHYTSKDRKR